MKLAILETGRPPGDLVRRFGDYPAMMTRMLDGELEIDTFDVAAGEFPADPSDYEAYLVTGSPAGFYDALPWIEPMKQFLRVAGDR
jgi:GMP synthase-like glutamine amidotransferase